MRRAWLWTKSGLLVAGLCLLMVGMATGAALGQTPDRAGPNAVNTTLGRGFTYQGYLEADGNPVDDVCDLRFDLWDAASGGNQIGGVEQLINVQVTDGRFTVTVNTANIFGYDAFTGSARWLRIRVRCPAGTGTYTTLSPRQRITAAPYASSLRPGATISGSVATGAVNLYSNWIGAYTGYAGADGFYVEESVFDSFQSQVAGDNGVEIRGAADYQGWFDGNIYVTGACSGCALATFGVNDGSTELAQGDIVTVQGMASDSARGALTEGATPLLSVARAQAGDTVVGVVTGWAELDTGDRDDPGDTPPHLVPRAGPAAPGGYVTIVTHGVAQVRLGSQPATAAAPAAAVSTVEAGERLTVGENGGVRGLQTVTVNGVQLSESAPSVGIALEPAAAAGADGMIWVLVNPQ